MRYRIAFTDRAQRELDDLPRHVQKRVSRWLDLLSADPRREGTKKLEGAGDLRRVHASRDYVIVYTIRAREVLVLIGTSPLQSNRLPRVVNGYLEPGKEVLHAEEDRWVGGRAIDLDRA